MRTAIWFSRHEPGVEQLRDMEGMGFSITQKEKGMRLGVLRLNSPEDVRGLLEELYGLIEEAKAEAVFGVFPTPLLQKMWETVEERLYEEMGLAGTVPCFSSWNVNRAGEGEKPSFEHRVFQQIGVI